VELARALGRLPARLTVAQVAAVAELVEQVREIVR
jgi:hypothetical protein